MYIKSMFKFVNDNKIEKEYKALLKDSVHFDLRRVSKLNLLALYGAINCLKDIEYSKSLSTYVATEYGCMDDIYKVLSELKQNNPIMPFDFLNINTNNTGFYISKAIYSKGNNFVISSKELSFEKTFYNTYFDFQNQINRNFLIGGVDESLNNILNYSSNIINMDNSIQKDGSSWLYLDEKKDNSIAQVEKIEYFKNLKELNSYLDITEYEIVSLNKFAKIYINKLAINRQKLTFYNNSYGTSSCADIIDMLNEKKKTSLYISLDSKQRAYIFHFRR